MPDHYPICALVETRMNDLGLCRSEFARRLGYKNIQKGMNRIDGFIRGGINHPSAPMILDGLPAALELDQGIIDKAMSETAAIKAQAQQQAELERSTAFVASAFLMGSQSQPSQIAIYGLTGGSDRWLRIPLKKASSPVTYAEQALEAVRNTPIVPFHGRIAGFAINYTPDFSVQFDLEGRPMRQFDGEYSPGQVSLFLNSRPVDAKVLTKLIN